MKLFSLDIIFEAQSHASIVIMFPEILNSPNMSIRIPLLSYDPACIREQKEHSPD